MTRIAVLFEFPTASGGEAAALEILRRLDRTRHDPVALAPAEGRLAELLREAGVEHLPFRIKGDRGNPPPEEVILAVTRAVEKLGAGLLHANSLALARYSGPAGERCGIPALAHCRDIQRLSAARARDVARNRKLVAVSGAVETALVGAGVPSGRIVLVPDGVDAARAASGTPGRLRAELGLDAGIPLVGCIGFLGSRKGQDVLVEAMPAILGAVGEARFVFVGSRFSRKEETIEYEAALHRRVAALGLGARARFLGQRADVPDVLADLDVLAHPANEEPQSIAVLEAMAAGKAIVATRVGGTPEVVEEGRTGLLVPPKDPAALAAAIVRVLTEPGLAQGLAEAGRLRALRVFRPGEAAARIVELYDELLAGKP